jgi:hypothetical protein
MIAAPLTFSICDAKTIYHGKPALCEEEATRGGPP